MSVLVFSDAQTAAAAAATLLAGQLIEKPSLVLGIDSSPALISAFHSLSAMTANGLLSWDKATIFQLSERVREEGKGSLRAYMDEALFGELSLAPGQVRWGRTDHSCTMPRRRRSRPPRTWNYTKGIRS